MSTFRQKVQATTDWGKPDPVEEAPARGLKARWRAGKPDSDAQPARAAGAGRRKSRSAPLPITAHRLFPAFAALWFAALFGLGSLAISSEVLGKLVLSIGLPALVPAAAPPLGFTAHLLVALALTVVGAALGLVLGMRLRPKSAAAGATMKAGPIVAAAAAPEADFMGVPKVRARDAHPDAPPRRPLVLTEAFADPVAPMAAPETWIPVYTPGGAAAQEPLDLASLDLAKLDGAELAGPELAGNTPDFAAPGFTAPDLPFAGPLAEAGPFAAPDLADMAQPEMQEPETGGQELPDIEASEPVWLEAAPREADEAAESAEPFAAAPTDAVSGPSAEIARPVLLAATPQNPSSFTLPPRGPLDGSGQPAASGVWSPVAGAPLESLGLVQLIERLALAIAAHKAASDAGPPPSAKDSLQSDEAADLVVSESAMQADEASQSEAPEEQTPISPASRLNEASSAVSPESPITDQAEAEAECEAEPDLPATDPSAPFAKPAILPQASAGEPVTSAREAILRRLGVDNQPVHVDLVLDAGPGPFSRPPQGAAAPAAAAEIAAPQPAAASLTPATSLKPAASLTPAVAAPVRPSAPLDADDALRSALATLQRMSVRG